MKIAITSPTDGLERIFTKERGFDEVVIIYPWDRSLPSNVDVVCFSGGADINPALYGQKPIQGTVYSPSRDAFDNRVYDYYKHLKKIGVCRGAQFLCAKNGGKLWQDVDGHRMCYHEVYDYTRKDDRKILVTSDHHQMCILKDGWKLLAHSINRTENYIDDKGHYYIWDMDFIPEPEVEAFFIPEDKAYCVQYHPEWYLSDKTDKQCEDFFFEQMRKVW